MKYSSFMSKWKFDTDCPVVDNTFRALDRKHRSLNRFLSEPLLPFSRHSYLSLSLYLYQFSMNPPMNERICKRNKTEVETRKSKLPIRSKIYFGKSGFRLSISTIEEETFAISTRGSLRWVFNFSIQHRDLTSLCSFLRQIQEERLIQSSFLTRFIKEDVDSLFGNEISTKEISKKNCKIDIFDKDSIGIRDKEESYINERSKRFYL